MTRKIHEFKENRDMKTYTLCGSMRFENEMKSIAYILETQMGYNILQCVYGLKGAEITDEERQRLTKAHYEKINISDGIYVVNIDGYVGESVLAEIEYARKKNKEIIFHCDCKN